ncbi:hypothetical protein F7Q99_21560 [Streptomyces kaniharaensis]|uniref:DUF1877 family protein n=1 Tax=Streptomyces kaniharaensis TaxID=212423 RepID=A0A6N7KWT3_9ACTN|nr:hypothetical protein [Streptomyces kaniharaensis]MQS14777.1 hypothetical protein [Streptomyces kaniharaensis]
MGNIYDYYAATDDTQALGVFEDGRIDDPFGTVGLKGVDPYLLLGAVEAHLTGVPEEQVEADPRFCELLSDPQHEGHWLVSLTDSLRDALAVATSGRLQEAAFVWTLAEDGAGQDAELVADFLRRLAELARDAGQRGLYCGMSL